MTHHHNIAPENIIMTEVFLPKHINNELKAIKMEKKNSSGRATSSTAASNSGCEDHLFKRPHPPDIMPPPLPESMCVFSPEPKREKKVIKREPPETSPRAVRKPVKCKCLRPTKVPSDKEIKKCIQRVDSIWGEGCRNYMFHVLCEVTRLPDEPPKGFCEHCMGAGKALRKKPKRVGAREPSGPLMTQVLKCRKTFGLGSRLAWCNNCKWKKACSRITK